MTEQAIAMLRDQLAGLLSQIDTSAKSRPNKINRSPHPVPGPEWIPVSGRNGTYTVRVADPSPEPVMPIVHVIWPDEQWSGDMDALNSTEARELAMALLAAADWADGLVAGVTPLDARRSENSRKEIPS
jgi:hypothetical protein